MEASTREINNAHSNVNWREQDLYGSSRLGMWLPNVNLAGNNAQYVADTVGKKVYELDNHLANVLTTVSDKRLQHSTNGTSIDYFTADVAAAQDYYPFGMLMPGRQYTFGSDSSYRYGFNGKENDNEVKGLGNEQDYGMRIYDPRAGRFLSVDPLSASYPYYTPYQFAGNSPIEAVDLDGLEPAHTEAGRMVIGRDGQLVHTPPKPKIKVVPARVVVEQTIAMADIHGNGHIGPQSVVVAQVAAVKQEYRDAVSDNIRDGLGGTIGYYIGGDKGSFVGATVDGVLLSTSSIREPAFFGPKIEPEIENTPTVYRVQGGTPPNASRGRILVNGNGNIDITGDDMLHVNIDDYSHAVYFLQKRGGSSNGVSIVSFEIPESLANEIKAKAVSQLQGKNFPDRPQIDDPTRSSSAYGLPKEYIEKLRQQAIPGTGRTASQQ